MHVDMKQKTSNKPLVIPVFIPHQGCPQNCLFCNQVSISGKSGAEEDEVTLVVRTITEWLEHSRHRSEVQVAFYGGSFTCLPVERQIRLLDAVQPFIQANEVSSIRLSTRPDCIDSEICDFLIEKGVKTVELGVQSLDDQVLSASNRGHCCEDSLLSARVVKEKGLQLGLQLMPGLPGETSVSFFKGLQQIIEIRPDFVRIYPTLVIRGAGLAKEYANGNYEPLTMNRAIALCCRARERLEVADIQIIRMGLQASETLEKELLAGPYHESFGELVASRYWFRRVRALLATCSAGKKLHLWISDRDVSAFVGQKRINIKRLQELGLGERLKLQTDSGLRRGEIKVVIV